MGELDLSPLVPSQAVQVWFVGAGGAMAKVAGQLRARTDTQLAISLHEAVPATLGVGQKVRLHLRSPEHGVLVYTGRVMAQNPRARIVWLVLADAVGRLQRRRFVRVPINGPESEATLLDADGGIVRQLPIRVLDLSIGGAKIEAAEAVAQASRLQFTLVMDGQPSLTLVLTALQCAAVPGSTTNCHHIRGRFDLLGEDEQLRLMRYVMQHRASVSPAPKGQ